MGRIVTTVTVENMYGPKAMPPMTVKALVDTGSSHLVLPMAWKEKFGVFVHEETGKRAQMASQDTVPATLCGPAQVQVDGFEAARADVLFVDMKPDAKGEYTPLLGYIALEACNALIDMDAYPPRLIPVKYYEMRRAQARGKD